MFSLLRHQSPRDPITPSSLSFEKSADWVPPFMLSLGTFLLSLLPLLFTSLPFRIPPLYPFSPSLPLNLMQKQVISRERLQKLPRKWHNNGSAQTMT
jgi:hypothetical protein